MKFKFPCKITFFCNIITFCSSTFYQSEGRMKYHLAQEETQSSLQHREKKKKKQKAIA
jgi:hypothetical protein